MIRDVPEQAFIQLPIALTIACPRARTWIRSSQVICSIHAVFLRFIVSAFRQLVDTAIHAAGFTTNREISVVPWQHRHKFMRKVRRTLQVMDKI